MLPPKRNGPANGIPAAFGCGTGNTRRGIGTNAIGGERRKPGRLPPGIAVRRTGRWSAAVRRAGTNCNCLLATEKRRSRAAGRLDWLWEVRAGLISGNSIGGGGLMQSDPNFGYSGGKVDLSTIANGIMDVPEGQALVFKNGMPYLMRNSEQIVDIDHKQPLSFGFSVRKGLARGFSVETGLTYTYLASDVKFVESSEKVSQKLHYLGIPLRANWNFVDKKSFIMYVSAGGAMEKCVYGKIGSESETVKPLQFSVMGAVGAQYNIAQEGGCLRGTGSVLFL